jgi:hypothetical protein
MSVRQDAGIMAKTVEPKNSASKSVVSLKVTLRGTKPPVWRRLLMQGEMTLGDLHQAIQAAMGWHDSHLHAFDIDGRKYGDRQTVDDVADENRLTLNSLLKSGVARFTYTYDFGDNWEHMVAIEKTQPALAGDPIRPALLESEAVPQKIAVVLGAICTCSKSWPIPLIRNAPNESSGSARSSTPTSSRSQSPTRRSLPASIENKTRRAPIPKPIPPNSAG